MSGSLAGFRPLLHASARHGRRDIAPWVGVVSALSASSVIVYPFVFPTVEERLALGHVLGANPAVGLIFGPAWDVSTVDGFNAWRSLAIGGFLTALMAIFTVVRGSRAQEDSGQAELLAAGVLGRSARLAVAVALAAAGSVAVGVVAGLVTVAFGGGWQASALLGATFTVTGWVFTAVAAVAAQLATDGRTASSLAVGALGALFLARGYLYSVQAPAWTVWLTPQGWTTETAPASGNHWWPLLIGVGAAALTLVVAFTLQARRDFGQGVIAPRPGPDRGRVRGPVGLAWRLSRGSLAVWGVAFVLLGFVFGYFTRSVPELLADNPMVRVILADGATTADELISGFLVTMLALIGIVAAVVGVQIMLKVRTEELDDRVEPVLAGAVSRPRFYGGHVLLALAAPALGLLVAGAILTAVAVTGDVGISAGDGLTQVLATVPAVWTVTAVAVAVVGARPAVRIAAWAGVAVSFGLTLLGPTFGLDDWVLGISPFWHVPNVALDPIDWSGLGWIGLVTVGFLAIGVAGFRRRDIAVT